MITRGLKFEKFDLHIHTPSSKKDVKGTLDADLIVKEALRKGLRGIAITDHGSVDSIDAVKEAASKHGLVVFPGVELLAPQGKEGVHIILLFDVDKDAYHVNQFLSKIGADTRAGKDPKTTEKTVGEIADELERFDSSAILVLPHCRSSRGVTGGFQGEGRTNIFKPHRNCLLGAEANEADFKDEDKKSKHKRIIDCFDGTDPLYHKRKLGVYQSSDAHSIEEIGSSYTYFKVDDEVTIEDLRQCLIDRDTRIRQSFEFREYSYPFIENLSVDSGFLKDQTFQFNRGLNSMLGAKGSGKSLAIEFLRFVLNQPPETSNLLEDHNSKLEECLKLHGSVRVVISDGTGKSFEIKRTYNPEDGNPIEIKDLTENTISEFRIEQFFPVLFLSQNEVVSIAEDKSGTSQRRFIDKFFDFYTHQTKIDRLSENLNEIDLKYADCLRAHLKYIKITNQITNIREEIEKLGRSIQNQVFKEYSKKERIGKVIKNQGDFIESLQSQMEGSKDLFDDLTPPSPDEPNIVGAPEVKRSISLAEKALDYVAKDIGELLKNLQKFKDAVDSEFDTWQKDFSQTKAKYDQIVKEKGGDQMILDQRRKKLIQELSNLEKEKIRFKLKSQQIGIVSKQREGKITELYSAYKDYYEERKERCEFFTSNSGGLLKVEIREREDTTTFRVNLIKLKKGSWLKDEEIETISQGITPQEFVEALMNYEWVERNKAVPLKKISEKTTLDFTRVEKLATHLLEENSYEEILSLLYTSTPKDVPSINYKIESTFKPIEQLSSGQKAAALLLIALSDGSFPVIIDQPEDSLDLKTIWIDVCNKLRGTKDERQFIFTTHNSSLAVASDTDNFVIIEANANSGKVVFSGSMNNRSIKDQVIKYLEGGKVSYYVKRKKYNL